MGTTTLGKAELPTGTLIPNMTPGSTEWLKVMSASKIPAMLGLSPWDSRYSLWQQMTGRIVRNDETDTTRRGHYLEPALLAWFTDQHPGHSVSKGASFAHVDRPWQTASPDGLLWTRGTRREAVGLVECKTALNDWEWGEPGTDEIPPYHRAQVQWQMDTTGVHRCHVVCLTTHFEFREYLIHYDQDDAAWLREQATEFLASIKAGIEPDLDDSDHTYAAIKQLHPGIDGSQIELSPQVAVEFLHAVRQQTAAKRAFAAARTQVAAEMGDAAVAKFAGLVYATRQSRGGGTPFVVTGRGLLDKEESAA